MSLGDSWSTVGYPYDSQCVCVHIPSVHPAEKFNQYPGHKFVFTNGCLINGSTGHACVMVEQAFTYQLHPNNSVFYC